VESAKFCEKINGILGNLRFFKAKCDAAFLTEIKTGKRKDVSLGFFYDYDATPGKWNGQPYDFVQRNILVDHVAAGVPLPFAILRHSRRCADSESSFGP
jgi:hypothetical protein